MPAGFDRLVSVRTEAVGQTSMARQAIISSSAFAGWRAKTLLSPRSTINPGATWRAAAQLMQAVSMYQSPGADWRFRSARLDVACLQADVDERLALFLLHHFQRTLERRHQILRLADLLAVTAARLDHVLKARRGFQRGERGLLSLRRKTLGIGRERRAVHRCPARVVGDDEEHRKVHGLGHVVSGGGIAEHVGPV